MVKTATMLKRAIKDKAKIKDLTARMNGMKLAEKERKKQPTKKEKEATEEAKMILMDELMTYLFLIIGDRAYRR